MSWLKKAASGIQQYLSALHLWPEEYLLSEAYNFQDHLKFQQPEIAINIHIHRDTCKCQKFSSSRHKIMMMTK